MSYRATKGMSTWGNDYRRQYMDKYHKKPFSERALANFEIGTEIHEYYQSQLKEKYYYDAHHLFPFSEFIVIAHEHPVYKQIQDVLFTSNIDTVLLKGKEFILIDYKSTTKLPSEPKLANMIQLSVYYDIFPLPEGYTASIHLCYVDKINRQRNRWFEFTPLRVDHIYQQQEDLLNKVSPTEYCSHWCPCKHAADCGLQSVGVITNIEITDGKKGPYKTIFMDNGDVFHGRLNVTEGDEIEYALNPNTTFQWVFEVAKL